MIKNRLLSVRFRSFGPTSRGRDMRKGRLVEGIHHLYRDLPLKHGGRWGTTDDFTASFLHFSQFSTALWDLANSLPAHSLMLSSHLFFCLLFLSHFTVPCKMVLVRPDEWETCPYHFSLWLYSHTHLVRLCISHGSLSTGAVPDDDGVLVAWQLILHEWDPHRFTGHHRIRKIAQHTGHSCGNVSLVNFTVAKYSKKI